MGCNPNIKFKKIKIKCYQDETTYKQKTKSKRKERKSFVICIYQFDPIFMYTHLHVKKHAILSFSPPPPF